MDIVLYIRIVALNFIIVELVSTRAEACLSAKKKDRKIQEAFLAQGAVVIGDTPAELDQIVKTEISMWKKLAKQANIKVN